MNVYVINVDSQKEEWEIWKKHAEYIGIPKDKLIRWSASIDDSVMPTDELEIRDKFEEQGYRDFGDLMVGTVRDRIKDEAWRNLNREYCIRAYASELSRFELYNYLIDTGEEGAIAMSDTAYFWYSYDEICDLITNLPNSMKALFFEFYPDMDNPLYTQDRKGLEPVEGFYNIFSNFALLGKYAYFSKSGVKLFRDSWLQMKGVFCRSVPRFMKMEGHGSVEDFYVTCPPITYRR